MLILGRPNVGKSSLFNRLVQKRKALVADQPGLTRDILKEQVSWWGKDFEVWDSGGLWSQQQTWSALIDKKVQTAIKESDLILFVMSARSGLLEEDQKTYRLIKKSGKPFLNLVNKVDDINKADFLLSDFYSLGEELTPCAFEKDTGISTVVEWIVKHLSHKNSTAKTLSDKEKQKKSVRLLMIGKVNVGKSTLGNALLKKDRLLTSDVPGTTSDIVADTFQHDKQSYTLLDTAGVGKVKTLTELKTYQSFKTADLILLLIDGVTGPTRRSARLLNTCLEEHKAVVVVVNKWDLVSSVSKQKYRKNIQDKFRFYPDLPVVFISALHSSGLGLLMKKVDEIYKKTQVRISTSQLNRFFTEVIRKAPAPVYGAQDVKFYYLTQTHRAPPSFVAFANYPKGVREGYYRFLVRQIQKKWNLQGIPIRISILPRGRSPSLTNKPHRPLSCPRRRASPYIHRDSRFHGNDS